MLRIVAGSARGLTLLQPTGRGTRPTSGRLREALFSMLEAADVDFSEVLDLYAGTGALGIEALSRGEGRSTFVESDAQTCALIRENLDRCKLGERGSVVMMANAAGFALWALVLTLLSTGSHPLAPGPFVAESVWEAVVRLAPGAVR